MFTKLPGILDNFLAPRSIRVSYGLENAQKSGPVVSIIRWKIRASKDRLAGWQQENRQWPAAAARHHLYCSHVDLIKIRTFLAINFDAYEVVIHDLRYRGIFEGFMFHYMTPVTGGIADAQQDQLVFFCCFIERFCTPREPVDRIVGMLQKIRASFVDEPVRHLSSVPH